MAEYIDGLYVGQAKSLGGHIEVRYIVEGGVVTSVDYPYISETNGIGADVAPILQEQLLADNGSTDGIETITGATRTCDSIVEAAEKAAACARNGYNDGVYQGKAKALGGHIEAEVTIEGGILTNLTFPYISETNGIGSVAAPIVQQQILELGSTDGVETVTGATHTCDSIVEAVNDCLAQASGEAWLAAYDAEQAEQA